MASPKFALREMLIPKEVVIVKEEGDTYGMFKVEPLERGFGTTFGNSIRRVLLSSIVGAAPIAAKISTKSGPAPHEFATLKGVITDTLDILLNVKSLRLKMDMDGIVTLRAEKEGHGKLLARDFEPVDKSADIKILNEDMVVAELSEDGRVIIEVQVRLGRGYIPAENLEVKLETGWIAIDAIYTPVERVNFEVENTRIGQITDYDKLLVEVWTDGSIRPRDALAHSAKVIKEHMSPMINFKEEDRIFDEENELTPEEKELQKTLSTPIDELELSVRSFNCLKSANILTLGQLASKAESELLKTRNFGRKSLAEIKDKLAQFNLELGMKERIRHLMSSSQSQEAVEAVEA